MWKEVKLKINELIKHPTKRVRKPQNKPKENISTGEIWQEQELKNMRKLTVKRNDENLVIGIYIYNKPK